jgi:carbamoyltransferase
MLRVARFRPDQSARVPAVVHVDGTGRYQTLTEANNGIFYRLVRAFAERTGVPILVNTSFNVMGEPIVETPDDALWALLYTGIDALVLEDRIVKKAPGFDSVLDLYPRITARKYAYGYRNDVNAATLDDTIVEANFDVATPWGETTVALHRMKVEDDVIDLLHAIDGRTSARELARRLNLDDKEMRKRLAALRRARIIRCQDVPAA